MPVVRSCSRCLGASAKRTPSPKRITEITHTQNGATTLSFTYQYDPNGNRSSETRTQSAINGQAGSIQTTAYAYDRDDRLIQTTVTHQPPDPATPDERTDWTLDAVGNRITEVVTRMADNTASSNKTYVYSDRDQLTLMTDSVHQISVAYTYDQNGNRTSRTVTRQGQPAETIRYSFDARDRMISAQPNAPNPGNAATIAYTYDPDGRRIERIENPVGATLAVATLYLYNGSTLQHEATPDATANTANATGLRLTDTYRTSAKLDRHIAFDPAGNALVRLYQLDALDSPVALTDASGATVTRTTYNAWGEIDQQTANGITQTPWQLPNYNPDQTGQAALLSNDGQILGFTGYQKDQATGLYYAQARWYDPLVGNFNAMDPAFGKTESPISFNTYLYANANPLVFVDPTGLCGGPSGDPVECAMLFAAVTGDDSIIDIQVEGSRKGNLQSVGLLAQIATDTFDTAVATLSFVADQVNGTLARLVGIQTPGIDARNLARVNALGDGLGTFAAKVVEDPFAATIGAAGNAFKNAEARRQDLSAQGKDFEAGKAVAGPVEAVLGGAGAGRALLRKLGTGGELAKPEVGGAPAPSTGVATPPTPPSALGDGAGVSKGAVAVNNTQGIESALTRKVEPDYGSGRGRRGSVETRRHIDEERDRFLEANPEYKHVAGGTDRFTGAQKPEEYIPGPDGGRNGSSFPDLTFEAPDGSRIRINTVDADDIGIMTPREATNFDRIFEQTGEPIIAVPKPRPRVQKRP